MWFARFKDSIFNQEIEMATNSGGGQTKSLTDGDSGRGAIFEHGASDRVAGAELVDFHNIIVS
jgi:hypothetical protein